MKPLSERDENWLIARISTSDFTSVGMKPLSERDENKSHKNSSVSSLKNSRNEATL